MFILMSYTTLLFNVFESEVILIFKILSVFVICRVSRGWHSAKGGFAECHGRDTRQTVTRAAHVLRPGAVWPRDGCLPSVGSTTLGKQIKKKKGFGRVSNPGPPPSHKPNLTTALHCNISCQGVFTLFIHVAPLNKFVYLRPQMNSNQDIVNYKVS